MAGTSQPAELLTSMDFLERGEGLWAAAPGARQPDLERQSALEADLRDVPEEAPLINKKLYQFYYFEGETPRTQIYGRPIPRDPKLFTANPKKPLPPSTKNIKGEVVTSVFKVKDVIGKNTKTALECQHSYDLVESMQYLYINVVSARNLAARNSSVDPYVRVSVGELDFNTQVIRKDCSPEWNRVFAVSNDEFCGQFLEISVWNADMVVRKDFLGALTFKLDGIPTRKPPENSLAPLWYKLEERPGHPKVQGEMRIALWMGNQTDEAFQEAWQSDIGWYDLFRSVYLAPRLWYLRVHVIEAKNLRLPDTDCQATPLVDISLGTGSKRCYKPNVTGPHPVWNKDFMFVVAEPVEEFLQVTVKGWIRSNQEKVIMGGTRIELAKIPLRSAFRQRVDSSWYDLGTTRKGVCQGRILLKLSWEGGYHVVDEPPDFPSCTRPSDKELSKPSLGVLQLGVIGACNLLPMHNAPDGTPTTNAYCVTKYGEKWIRTRTITDSFSPMWNENYTWEVYDPRTVLTLGVFDNRNIHNGIAANADGVIDTPIAKIRIRLSTLDTNRAYTISYPLLVVTPTGIKQMGELLCSVRFSCACTFNVMQAYLQPRLPAMHYFVPIGCSELESLRVEAMDLVASRLARFEPPLRREVVKFMLAGSKQDCWSMRRSKACYYRIGCVLTPLMAAHKWFDKIRTWKNPGVTVLVHMFLLAFVWHPEFLLPMLFSSTFVTGAWNYRLRPCLPAAVSIQLSLGGETAPDLDELQEEFNVFTGNATQQFTILKNRYARVRLLAGQIQLFMDNVAMLGERLQALLSWRDPRATLIFVTFSLVAAIVSCVMPIRLMAVLLVFYVLRHPFFRNPLPAACSNLLLSVPTRSDQIL